jgi:hypothetical protein
MQQPGSLAALAPAQISLWAGLARTWTDFGT